MGLALVVAAVGGLVDASPASWTNVGPAGGGVSGVAVDPDDARHAIVLDSAGIAHETRDRGASWKTGDAVGCGHGSGFIRGGSYYASCFFSAQRTADGGNVWRTFYPQPAGGTLGVHEVLPDPRSPGGALVTSDSSPRVTLDEGRTWSVRTYPGALTGVPPVAFDPSVQGRLVAVENPAVPVSVQGTRQVELWESDDGAATWRMASIVYQYAFVDGCAGRAVGIDGGGTVYVMTNCGVHVSRDRGLTWSFHDDRGDGFGPNAVTRLSVDALRPGHAAVSGGSAIIETFDSGATWSVGPSPPAFDSGGQVLAFAADGAAWAATTQGLYRRDAPGSAWSPVAVTGLRAAIASFVIPASADGQVLITDTQRSVDGGATWAARPDSVMAQPIRVAGRPSQLYEPTNLASQSYALTSDGGGTWQPAGLTLRDGSGNSIGTLAPTGVQPGVIYAATFIFVDSGFGGIPQSAGVVRSDDGGRTWISIDAGITGGTRSVVASGADPRVVYASTSDGVFRSTTAGSAWTRVHLDAGAAQVAPDGLDASTFYVFTGSAILASRDGGATFIETTPDVRASIISVIADPLESGRAYATGSNGAVFQTRDRGATWQQATIGGDTTITGYVGPVVAAGNGRLLRAQHNSIYSVAVPADPFVLDAAVWWNPSESGWGLSIVQHPDNQTVAVWYHYDAQGQPRWSIVPGGSWVDARTFVGTMYVTSGPAYFGGPFDPSRVSVRRQGTASLRFADADAADVSFVLDDGTRFDRHVVRQRFAAQTGAPENLGDLWWNANESGWGLAMHQEGGTVFSTWFVYDSDGNPAWLVAPDMEQLGRSSSTSDLFTTTGPAYTGAFDPSKVVATRVGTISIVNGQETRWLSYSVLGKAGSTPIERQPF